ncbi:hypothetical protein SAMN02745945_01847 [Peptoclostridium litorale DSM 5388]|uniref:Uncharacterized protein n=1 Tax=Peptoclostridium litorale DSM 5388 TaxID=1121324 RepID=A0A069RFQ7_PEPLI|nr:hypothetical protein [Peptoclostridium litorale]KDR95879.1 hypothetical protein CLIT_8c00480 [Peptoclostridium litorale DSM 5388]SIO10811.1 hypothetical protein SAMN02745945_01847 [Peptoclostridium litorale DSM 5388]
MENIKACFNRDDKKSHRCEFDGMEGLGAKDIAALVAASFSVIAPFMLCCMLAAGTVLMLMSFLVL